MGLGNVPWSVIVSRCRLAGLTAVMLAAWGIPAVSFAGEAPIRIGAPLPLTGALSPEGVKLQQGYELWKDTVNAAGGIAVGAIKRPVEIVYYDYQSATPKAVQLAEKLATDDKVDFMFAPFGSGASKAASTVSERYGIPMLAPTASSPEVYDQGYKNLFGTFTANDTLSEPMAEIVKAKAPNIKRVAILARNDLFPLALGQEFEKSSKKRGLDVVYFEKYAINTLDHASALTEIKAAKPDWIIATGYINDMILIRKQMADLGIKAQIVTMINAPAYQEFINSTGPLAENVTSATWWHPAVRYVSKDVFGSAVKYTEMFQKRIQHAARFHECDRKFGWCRAANGDRKGGFRRSRQGSRDPWQRRVRHLLRPAVVQQRGPGRFLRAAGVPDPERKAGRDLSRRDQRW